MLLPCREAHLQFLRATIYGAPRIFKVWNFQGLDWGCSEFKLWARTTQREKIHAGSGIRESEVDALLGVKSSP